MTGSISTVICTVWSRFEKRVEEEMGVKACSNQPKVTLAVAMRQRLAQMKKESMKKRTYRRAK